MIMINNNNNNNNNNDIHKIKIKIYCLIIKNTFKNKKQKQFFSNYENMHIYCKKCNKHTGNTYPKKLILISKN